MKKLTHFNISRWKFVAASLALATMVSCTKPENPDPGIQTDNTKDGTEMTISPGRYIVVLNSGDNDTEIKSAIEKIQSSLTAKQLPELIIDQSDIFKGAVNGFTVTLSPEQVKALKATECVASLDEDKVVSMSSFPDVEISATSPTPPLYTDVKVNYEVIPWGVTCVGARGSNGTGKVAWIIDSGIKFGHPDLNVDQVRSKSFLTEIDGADYATAEDKLSHGTHVAGVIGAKANNIGTVGVAPNTTLISLRVVNATGMFRSVNIILALNWAYTYGKAGDVVCLGLKSAPIGAMDNIVLKLNAKGIFLAVAAGNSNSDCINYSPQRVNALRVATVSAMDAYNKFWPGSNFGSPVDYAAPGSRIYTTTTTGYNYCSGTEYAAAHVAGIMLLKAGAVVKSGYVLNDPDLKPDPIARK